MLELKRNKSKTKIIKYLILFSCVIVLILSIVACKSNNVQKAEELRKQTEAFEESYLEAQENYNKLLDDFEEYRELQRKLEGLQDGS